MQSLTVCRCCLAEGLHKDIYATYTFFDKKEVYSQTLQECFNIVLSSPIRYSGICDACIALLRSSSIFKQNVIHSEEVLMKKTMEIEDVKPVEVKIEPLDCDGDDSDDYFLSEAVTCDSKIKMESPDSSPKKKTAQKKSKRSIKKDRKDNIKDLVTRLTTIRHGKQDGPQLTIKKMKEIKPRKIIRNAKVGEEIKFVWSGYKLDKWKHRENLQTILEFSNVVPFKNRSLLGYMCGYCDGTYPDPADLRAHTEAIHSKERLNFKTNFDMTEYNVKVDITDLTCTLCDHNLENLTSLKDHLTKIHSKVIHDDIKDHILQFKLKKGDVYDCAMCSATYETFKMLKQHMNVHYRNYTCPKCETSFATKRSLNAHQATHQEGSFKCDQCEKVFPSRAKKQYHEKTKHLGARNVGNCPFCNEPFRSYYQRNQHLVKVHNSEAKYKCNVCNKSYILKSLLMYHIKKSHLMERNCQCTECGYRFFSKKALKAHMVKHTGERNYQCEVCHKSYARKYTLREHMRIHNNDRRFKCDVCAMCFVQKCSLKSHLLSNHGISLAASDITTVDAIANVDKI